MFNSLKLSPLPGGNSIFKAQGFGNKGDTNYDFKTYYLRAPFFGVPILNNENILYEITLSISRLVR